MALTSLRNKHFDLNTVIGVSNNYNWQLYGETRNGELNFDYFKIENNSLIFYNVRDGDQIVYQNGTWVNSDYRYINIYEGADAETTTALNWFTVNATEIILTFNISYNLTGLTAYGENVGDPRPTTITEGTNVLLTLVPDTDYGLPANISVEGCEYSYNNTYGTVSLSNPTADVTITAIGIFHKVYPINTTLTNLIYSGDNTIETDGTASATLVPYSGYYLPETITVTGCSYTYNKNTGAITLSNPPHSSAGVYIIATASSIDTHDLTLTLYNNQAERIQALKLSKMTVVGTVTGTLREPSSLVKPSINMEYAQVPNFNYVYIPNFKRYYYVNNITSISKNIWRIDLSVDVLMSYYVDFRELTGIVKRQENSYNNLIIDNMRPRTSKDNYSIVSTDTGYGSGFNITTSAHRYVITSLTNVVGYEATLTYQKSFTSNTKLLLDADNLANAIKDILGHQFTAENIGHIFVNTPLEALLSVRLYPFDVGAKFGISTYNSDVYLGNYKVGNTKCAVIRAQTDALTTRVFGGRFNLTGNTWVDYSSTYIMYIPFCGFESFDASELLGKYIKIEYIVDYDTGHATANIYSSSSTSFVDNNIIRSKSTPLAVEIPISQANTRDQVNSMLSGAISSVIGTLTGNPLAIVGGIGSIMNNITPHFTTSGQSGGAWSSALTYLQPFIIKITPDYITPTNYGHLHGYPSMQSAQLKTLTGYTVMDEIHVEDIPNITEAEQTELETILKSGFIM